MAASRAPSAPRSARRSWGDIGGFGGLYAAPRGDRPVLVSSVDSVGTKVRVAIGLRRHDTVGHDIVNHCVNDILCGGARPLFFLDYIGIGQLDPPTGRALSSPAWPRPAAPTAAP